MNRRNKKSRWTKISLAVIFVALLILVGFLIIRPLPEPSLENSEKIIGILDEVVEEGGPSDLVVTLKNDKYKYYINRGTLLGLNPEKLNQQFMGSEVILYYAKHWTPLDPSGTLRHITKFIIQDSIVYHEF